MDCILNRWLSKCATGAASPGNLLEMRVIGPLPRLTETNSGGGPDFRPAWWFWGLRLTTTHCWKGGKKSPLSFIFSVICTWTIQVSDSLNTTTEAWALQSPTLLFQTVRSALNALSKSGYLHLLKPYARANSGIPLPHKTFSNAPQWIVPTLQSPTAESLVRPSTWHTELCV